GQNGFVLGNLLADLLQLGDNLFFGELGQAVQLQFKNGIRLARAQLEALHQAFARFEARSRGPDELDHGVQIVERDLVAFQDVLALAGPGQQVGGAAAHNIHTMVDEVLNGLDEPHLFGLPVDHSQEDHAEAFLHAGVFVELVQNDLWLSPALEFNHNAHAVAARFIAHVGDIVNYLVEHQVCNALNQVGFVDLVGNLGNDDRLAVFGQVLNGSLGAHCEATAPGPVGFRDAAASVNEAAGWEVWTFYNLQNLFERGLRIIHQQNGGIQDFRQVMRRDVGCHPHGNTIGAVDQQVGNPGRQHHWLSSAFIEISDKIHRILVNIGQHLVGNLHQAGFGITIGRGRVAIDGPEISLSIHQRIAQAPGLRQPYQRVIHRAVSVRVIFLQALAHYAGALGKAAVIVQSFAKHRVENAAMHRLEPVIHTGQCATIDDRH